MAWPGWVPIACSSCGEHGGSGKAPTVGFHVAARGIHIPWL